MTDRPFVRVHADESCLGNQFMDRDSPGGAAGLVETWTGGRWVRRDYWISEPATTNNRMALRSAIEPLKALNRPCRVRFVSDSQYLVKGIKEWLPGWKARGWKRKSGLLENVELWQELDRVMDAHILEPSWTRGHAGHAENEYANYLATRAATAQDDSRGLVESGFEAWLAQEREQHGRYLDYREAETPESAPPGRSRPR